MNVSNLSNVGAASWGEGGMHGVSGASGYTPPASSTSDLMISQMRLAIKQNTQDFKALKGSLGSNDLAGAKQAYQAVQQDIQKASKAAGGKSPFDPNSPIGKDFKAIGDALSSGDLASAQKAFSAFRQDIRAAGHVARQQQISAAAAATAGTTTANVSSTGFNASA